MRYSVVAMIADGTPDQTYTSIDIKDVRLAQMEIPVVFNRQLPPVGNAILTIDEKDKLIIAHILLDKNIDIRGRYPHLGGSISGQGVTDESGFAMPVSFEPKILSLNTTPNPDKRIGMIE